MKKYRILEKDDYLLIENEGGKTLGLAKDSPVKIIEADGYAFKDLNQNGVLDPYEDWRLDEETRIEDLAKQLSVDEIAGLMLYSNHQSIASGNSTFANMFGGTYDGKSLAESGKHIWDLTDQQKKFLSEDDLRHVLVTKVDDARTAALWNNQVQKFVERIGHGIPANNSSDPRHAPSGNAEFNAGAGGDISKWPEPLGLAATFDPELVARFGRIAATEYRYLGIATALSPQIDMASDPRWMRFNGTFGEDSKLASDMAEAYCNGFQNPEGWGNLSVNAMVKHWPGGASGEGGRDAHFGYGKYAVYPGNNFEEHLIPFTQGAFDLKGKTKKAAAVMPYYTISYNQDTKNHENVGNSYSKYMITDLLRNKYGYDGVVCTDWSITHDNHAIDQFLSGKCWGKENESVAKRHYDVLMAGVDQFGGNNDKKPILEAYEMGAKEHGEAFIRERFEASAKRLLRNIFQTGLFENPYVDAAEAKKIVGCPEFMAEGYHAQQKSIVLLKNKSQVLPVQKNLKVYIPERRIDESSDWFGHVIPAHHEDPVSDQVLGAYYQRVKDPQKADFAIVFIESPNSVGYKKEEDFVPITLQYRPYKAEHARVEAIAGGKERSYYMKENLATNHQDLDIILETREKMADKPVIVVMNAKNPTVVSEFEKQIDGLLVHFNVQNQAILDIISGTVNPSGLLPFQMPADMKTVEEQYEDVSHDMNCHTDECGNTYDFAFGLDFNGVIDDARVKKYRH